MFSKSRVPIIHELYEKVVLFFIYSTLKKLRRFHGIQFGINCTALDQSKLCNFVECTITIEKAME